MHQTLNINAGDRLEFYEVGDFFRLMNAMGTISVEFYKSGKEIAEARNVGSGYGERFFREPFDRFVITSSTKQTIQIAARLGGEIWYDTPPVGNVAITNTSGPFENKKVAVGTNSVVIDPDNSRRYVLIQNNDQVGDIFVRFDGVAATVDTGVKIPAGGSYELQGFVPNGEITAIGNIAANSNIVFVKG